MLTPQVRFSTSLDRLIPDLEALYKDVHAHPELSISVQWTRCAATAEKQQR